MTEDRFASYDAAYVLGALSPKDRQEYEQHLQECADCARAVRELAGMPGLLAKVPTELVTDAGLDGPPDTLLPDLLARTRTQRRRRRGATIATSVLAAAACLVLAVFLAVRPLAPDEPPPAAIPTVTMSPVRSAPVYATVGLENVAWGTKVNMHCMYEKDSQIYGDGKYYLVVIADDGAVEHIGSWTVQPGKDAKLQGATSWSVTDIEAIEVRTSEGRPVLRLQP